MQWGADDIMGLLAIVAVLVIPSLGLTARFAVKPIVESMLRIRESLDRSRPPAEDERLAALETRMDAMQDTLERVAQAVEFDRQLQATPSRPAITPAAVTGPRLVRPVTVPPLAESQPSPALHPADYEEEYL